MKRPLLTLVGVAFALGAVSLGQSLADYRRQLTSLVGSYQWRAALELVDGALREFPEDPWLLVIGSALESRAGDPSEAAALLRRALRQPLDADLLRLAAGVQLQSGERLAATQLLTRALEQSPDDPRNHYELAYLLLVDDDLEGARDRVAHAVELDPRDSQFRHLYALVLERMGDRDGAYQQLREAQRMAPDDARLLLRLSDREKQRGRLEQALEYLDLAAELDPENPLYPTQAAALYAELGRLEEAEQSRRRGKVLEAAFDAYSEALRLAGSKDLEAALRVLEPVVAEQPQFSTGALLLGQLYRQLGRQEKALQLYLDLLAKDPARSEAREAVAWIRAQSGDLESAVATLQEGSARSLNELLLEGHRSLLGANWTEAIGFFRRVEAHYPLDPQLLQLISFTLNEMGEVEQALGYLEKAHRLLPADGSIVREARAIRAEHGLKRLEERDFRGAEAVFRELIREDSVRAEYRFQLAYALQRQGRTEEAIDQYGVGLRRDPGAEWARVNLAACLYAVGRQSEATGQWRELVARRRNPEYVYNLGLSLIRELRLEEGWKLVETAAGDGHAPARRLLRRARRH